MEGEPKSVTSLAADIPAGQFLVYYFQSREHMRCDRDGKLLNGANAAGVLFLSFEDAERFAKAEADRSPRVGTGIYDSAGQIAGQFFNSAFAAKQARANTPARLFLWAGALLLAGSAFLWIEAWSGWTVAFGFVIGSRLLFSGVLKLGNGVYQLRKNRTVTRTQTRS